MSETTYDELMRDPEVRELFLKEVYADHAAEVSELKEQLAEARELLREYRNNTMNGDVHAKCKFYPTRCGAVVDFRCNICRVVDEFLEEHKHEAGGADGNR